MPDSPDATRRMSLSEKFSRLRIRLRKPEWRRYGGTLLAGKVLGIALVLAIMAVVTVLLFSHVYAADPDLKGNDIVNPSKHRLDADRGVPRVRHASRVHDAGSRLLPFA